MNTNAIVKKITKTVLGVTKSVLGTTSKATTTGGKKLVAGLALYKLTGDNANNPHCTGACAKDWPPLLFSGTGTPQAQGSIGNHTLGVVSNKNGK
jgi:predicted lipoprotein with Yx(FWY)xxD motif